MTDEAIRELSTAHLLKGARFTDHSEDVVLETLAAQGIILAAAAAAEVIPQEQPGMKFDSAKNRLDLIYWPFVEGVGEVLTHGAVKYAPNNWQKVGNGLDRYFAAAMRHLIAYRRGELTDSDSGLPHLAHVATNVMFLQYLTSDGATDAGL